MGCPPDERLPEVVPAQVPQALSPTEAWMHGDQLEERDPKYFVAYDDAPMQVKPDDAPKILTDDGMGTGDTPIMSALSPTGTIPWEHRSAMDNMQAGDPAFSPLEKVPDERRICGLRRKIFFLGLGALIIIVAASVGGGVGGGLAAANARNQAAAASTPTPTNAGTGGDPGTGTSDTSSAASPTYTHLQNKTASVFFKFQGWEEKDYKGRTTGIMVTDGYYDLNISVLSYIWAPEEVRSKPDCCVTLCTNRTYHGGFWCQEKRQTLASGKFGRIWMGCGNDVRQPHKCSPEDPDGTSAGAADSETTMTVTDP